MEALKASDPDAWSRRATTIRTDDAWVDAGENDTALIQTLTKNPNVVGVLGFSSAEQNHDRIKAAQVNGIEPTFQNIATGDYRISRSMYFYVKAEKGLIPLPADERDRVRAHALALTLMETEG